MKTTRIPHAPGTPLPELAEFLAPFRVHFHRSEGPQALERYLTGLLTEHPNKNCDTIAQVVPGTSEQRLQGLLTAIDWDEDDLNRQRVQDLLRLPTEGDGVLIFDDTGFAKQGSLLRRRRPAILRHPGQGRQLPGHRQLPLRRADHRLAGRHPALPARALGPRRRPPREGQGARGGHLPDQAADRPGSARPGAGDWGVRCACVTADADYGDNPNFLDGLEKRRKHYVVAVRADFAVALSRRGGPTQRADVLVGAQAARSWRSVTWREGSQGWMRGRFVALRGWRVTSSGRRRAGWLIGEDASDGKRRYYWSNFGPEVALERMVEYAHRRHWVEQYHEEAKGLLGWDQYQGRLWPGFHRHAVSVMLAYSFLVWQEWQQRQERARRADRGGLFPLGRIDVGCRCRRSIARSATGSGSKRPRSCCCVNS